MGYQPIDFVLLKSQVHASSDDDDNPTTKGARPAAPISGGGHGDV